jgi:3-hydroxyacyl-[acyl-carrier-protein] dehydratase|tara:strand:- start:3527 stop:4048 length:522 start_codon:yes stop_codon:yes gene_type:complete
VPKRDLIIDPTEIDLSNVVADLDGIRRYNPQRHEMEQLTAIVFEDTDRGVCVGYKDVTREEFWIRGHMPDMPLMPGVIMCEAAAQLSSYYAQKHDLLKAKMVGFGGMEDIRFRDPVVPGDRLVMATQLVKARPRRILICRFQGFVRNEVVVEGVIKGIPLPVEAVSALMGQSS